MDKDVLKFVFTVGLFVAAMLPLLIDNLRNGTATNGNNFILALGGILSLVIGHLSGWNQQSLWSAGAWIAMGGVTLMLVSILGLLPGGVAKMMMALLPWFTITNYFTVIAVGFILTIPIVLTNRRSLPMALPLAFAGIVVLFYDLNAGMAA